MNEVKICVKCHVAKEFFQFHRHTKNKDGRNNTCKSCVLDRMKKNGPTDTQLALEENRAHKIPGKHRYARNR